MDQSRGYHEEDVVENGSSCEFDVQINVSLCVPITSRFFLESQIDGVQDPLVMFFIILHREFEFL